MVRHVLVQVGQDQKELQHAISLIGIRLSCAFLEILHDSQRIREQPFQALWVRGNSAAAAIERLIRSMKGFIKKMIEAKLLAGEGHRDRLYTRSLYTISSCAGAHNTPRTLGGDTLSEELGETTTYLWRGNQDASKCAMANPAGERTSLKGNLGRGNKNGAACLNATTRPAFVVLKFRLPDVDGT